MVVENFVVVVRDYFFRFFSSVDASFPRWSLRFLGVKLLWWLWKPSISLKILLQASFGLDRKSCFLHLRAKVSCHCRFALFFSFLSLLLVDCKVLCDPSEPLFMCILKASFLSCIHFRRDSSDSVNQSGRFFRGLLATSEAACSRFLWNWSSRVEGQILFLFLGLLYSGSFLLSFGSLFVRYF